MTEIKEYRCPLCWEMTSSFLTHDCPVIVVNGIKYVLTIEGVRRLVREGAIGRKAALIPEGKRHLSIVPKEPL